jgi:hypothetical protein
VRIENVVEEEEYNQFDEIPSLRSDHSEKIHIQKSRKKKQV